MNNVQKSVVEKIPKNSTEFAVVQTLCNGQIIGNESTSNTAPGTWSLYRKVLLDVSIWILSKTVPQFLMSFESGDTKL